jgi:hypothetical protein
MILEVIPAAGVGGQPIRFRANQVIIRHDDMTIAGVAAVYGPRNAIDISVVGDDDFAVVLRNLGIRETVICDRVELAKPPPGARLVSSPY